MTENPFEKYFYRLQKFLSENEWKFMILESRLAHFSQTNESFWEKKKLLSFFFVSECIFLFSIFCHISINIHLTTTSTNINFTTKNNDLFGYLF